MPKIVNIASSKFFSQFKNGTDFDLNPSIFSTNLLAVVGEKVKAVFDLEVEWYSNANPVVYWDIATTSITRSSGTFFSEGFMPNQVFDYLSNWTGVQTFEFNATIVSITNQGRTINFTVNSGFVTTGTETNVGIRATAAENPLYSLEWNFGILNGNESWNNISKVSGNSQSYIGDDIGIGGTRSTTPVQMSVNSQYQDWVTGSVTAAYVSETTYVQTFQVVHIFTVNPFSAPELLFLPELLTVPADFSPPMRYSFQSIFKQYSIDSGGISAIFNDLGGNARWYQTNDSNQPYLIDSVTYTDFDTSDPVLSLTISERTTVEIVVSKKSGSFSGGQRVGLQVIFLEQNESNYQNTQTTALQNFIYDLQWYNEGDPATLSASTPIRSLQSSTDAGVITITAEIEYLLAEQLKAAGGQYLLSLIIGDESLPVFKFSKSNLIVDINSYADVNIIPSLCTFDTINFYEHDAVYPAGARTSVNSWNEDGILIEIPFSLDLNQSAFLSRFTVKLAAFNTVTNKYFELDSYSFNTASAIVSGGVQQININNTRNYRLSPGSQFNWAKIETGANVGGIQSYKCLLGQKLSWQDWISNLEADTVFYDNSKSNNNLNDKSSNYSGLSNYEIRIVVEASVSGVDSLDRTVSGVSEGNSGNINVFDYSIDGNPTPIWSGVIKTFDSVTGADLGGEISLSAPTVFEVQWTNSAGAVTSTASRFIIHRIEDFNDAGYQIEELSSINANPRGNRLVSSDGSGLLVLSVESGKLVSRCLIDSSQMGENQQFNLSARIKK